MYLKKERPEKSNLMLRLLKKTLGRCLKMVNADRIQYSFHDSHFFKDLFESESKHKKEHGGKQGGKDKDTPRRT